MKRHLPNLLTLLNVACGTAAIVLTLEGQWKAGVYLLLAAALLDFLDGFSARLLKAYSDTGKQLDSLADMVTFGVLPTVFIYLIFKHLFAVPAPVGNAIHPVVQWIITGSVLIVPVFSAVRLARFNLQEGGTAYFRGLSTPAHALFWTGLFWQFMNEGLIYGNGVNVFFMWGIMLLMAFYLILPVPMLSLKFEHFSLRGNISRYLVILVAIVILLLTGLSGLTLVVLCYILISLLNILLRTRLFR